MQTCNFTASATFLGTAMQDCSVLASHIKTCQSNGNIITLSLGGATGAVWFTSCSDAVCSSSLNSYLVVSLSSVPQISFLVPHFHPRLHPHRCLDHSPYQVLVCNRGHPPYPHPPIIEIHLMFILMTIRHSIATMCTTSVC